MCIPKYCYVSHSNNDVSVVRVFLHFANPLKQIVLVSLKFLFLVKFFRGKNLENCFSFQMEDVLWAGLTDSHIKLPMAITAENLAVKYNLNREEVDEIALRSQTRWKAGLLIVHLVLYF